MPKYTQVTIRGHKYYKSQLTEPDGKRKTLYAKTVTALRQKEREYHMQAQNAAASGELGPTVAEYAAQQLAYMRARVTPATYVGYETKVRLHIAVPPLGDKRLAEVTRDDVQRAMLGVADKSESYYHATHMLMRTIFRVARLDRLIDDDPTEGIPSRGGRPQTPKQALSDDEAAILLSAIEGLPVETYVLIGLFAGMRREEILALAWDCVMLDTDYPYIKVRRAWRVEHNRPIITDILKSDAARRDIPIPRVLADHLRTLRGATTAAYVIANRDGNPLSGTQWRHYWRQLTRRTTAERTYTRYADGGKTVHKVTPVIGSQARNNPEVTYTIPFEVTPHQLRHTYITNLISGGCDPKTVQYLAGHSTSKMTMDQYAKVKYNRPEDIGHRVAKALGEER